MQCVQTLFNVSEMPVVVIKRASLRDVKLWFTSALKALKSSCTPRTAARVCATCVVAIAVAAINSQHLSNGKTWR